MMAEAAGVAKILVEESLGGLWDSMDATGMAVGADSPRRGCCPCGAEQDCGAQQEARGCGGSHGTFHNVEL